MAKDKNFVPLESLVDAHVLRAIDALLNDFLDDFFKLQGFTLASKTQVQNYSGLHNCVFDRTTL